MAITAFAAATSALALYAFNRYRAGFDELVSNNLPALAAASELAQRSEKLSASAPALAVAESHFARQAIKQELDDQLQGLSRIADDLERLSGANLSALKQYKQAFSENLVQLDNMVAQRIDAEATAGNALIRLGMLSSRIQALAAPDVQSLGESGIPDGDPDQIRAWAAAASAEVVVLLSTATADNAAATWSVACRFFEFAAGGASCPKASTIQLSQGTGRDRGAAGGVWRRCFKRL